MSNGKGVLVSLGITGVIGFIVNYLCLPAWNLHSGGFWLYLIVMFGIFATLSYICTEGSGISVAAWVGTAILFVLMLILLVFSSRLINSKSYADMIEDYIREEDISTYAGTVNNVPLLDKDSAMLIANRELGSLIDVVSQFEIHDSEQITVKGVPVRVSVLEYGSFMKWVNNKETGTPGYIKVDMKTQDAELIRVDGGIKYSPSEYFGRDLLRHVRKKYSSLILEKPTLELNEEGHPYWIIPIVDYTIGVFGGKDISGALTVDAVTGEIVRYKADSIPEWLDNVYPSDLIMTQYDDYGQFQSGFLNSIFGQKGVKVTTDGYNYIPQLYDNWIYTGVTSTGRDESNIGFILVNKRTKEIIYYPKSGAEEYSAMSSAEGVVQHLGYKSTFPLLLIIEGQPTYMVTLKDAGGLVKMIGMVNVEKYHIVATGNTIAECQKKYRELLKNNGSEVAELSTSSVVGIVVDIKEAIKDGTTYYYIQLENSDKYYSLSILDNEEVVLLQIGDKVKLGVISDVNGKIIPSILN